MKELEAACAAEGIALTANMRLELARVAIYFGHFDVSFFLSLECSKGGLLL